MVSIKYNFRVLNNANLKVQPGQPTSILSGEQTDPTLCGPGLLDPGNLLDDQLFTDFDWTFGDNVFFNTPPDFAGFGAQAAFPDVLGPNVPTGSA